MEWSLQVSIGIGFPVVAPNCKKWYQCNNRGSHNGLGHGSGVGGDVQSSPQNVHRSLQDAPNSLDY